MNRFDNSGLMLLKKQQAEKVKRLEGLTLSNYFHAMEEIRQGLLATDYLVKIILS